MNSIHPLNVHELYDGIACSVECQVFSFWFSDKRTQKQSDHDTLNNVNAGFKQSYFHDASLKKYSLTFFSCLLETSNFLELIIYSVDLSM